jgi:para-aminobenzoate synthetase
MARRLVQSLLIDNYDSYTYNLYQMLSQVNGLPPIVITNDAFHGDWDCAWRYFLDQVEIIKSRLQGLDQPNTPSDLNLTINIVLSPGPGHPANTSDFGLCRAAVLKQPHVPLLGVCLGHQGIAHVYGGTVTYAPEVMHGRTSTIHHTIPNEQFLFGTSATFDVVRYHSLVVTTPLPSCLTLLATTHDGLAMALKHTTLPQYGVQFHPESVCSEFGYQLLHNFRNLSIGLKPSMCSLAHQSNVVFDTPISPVSSSSTTTTTTTAATHASHRIDIRRLNNTFLDSADVFQVLYGEESSHPAFWLDSSNGSRFSFMGDISGPQAFLVEYELLSHTVTTSLGNVYPDTDILTFIQSTLDTFAPTHTDVLDSTNAPSANSNMSNNIAVVPFEFRGGFVGYFGYESLDRSDIEAHPHVLSHLARHAQHDAKVPDAAFLFCDRVIVFDHVEKTIYLVAIDDDQTKDVHVGSSWMTHMQERLENWTMMLQLRVSLPPQTHKYKYHDAKIKNDQDTMDDDDTLCIRQRQHCHPQQQHRKDHRREPIVMYPSRPRAQYEADIATILAAIHEGNTYEVCLTNQLLARVSLPNTLDFYLTLRQLNPAPFAGFLRFPLFSICSSSPERFLSIDGAGVMESKPIKGTRRRHRSDEALDAAIAAELQACTKDRAENMMITDLVRNDFGQVCRVGSVHVPTLMHVESFATVHQLVTTVCIFIMYVLRLIV